MDGVIEADPTMLWSRGAEGKFNSQCHWFESQQAAGCMLCNSANCAGCKKCVANGVPIPPSAPGAGLCAMCYKSVCLPGCATANATGATAGCWGS